MGISVINSLKCNYSFLWYKFSNSDFLMPLKMLEPWQSTTLKIRHIKCTTKQGDLLDIASKIAAIFSSRNIILFYQRNAVERMATAISNISYDLIFIFIFFFRYSPDTIFCWLQTMNVWIEGLQHGLLTQHLIIF